MSKNTEQDVAFIRALAELLRESDLSEIEIEREYGSNDELKVRLSRSAPGAAVAGPVVPQLHYAGPVPASPGENNPVQPAKPTGPDISKAVTSPMVGTVYLAPEPGASNFVLVGDEVSEGQTILIIEAMKTMNQIPSPRAGKVRSILVENAEPVEFGAPLIIIE